MENTICSISRIENYEKYKTCLSPEEINKLAAATGIIRTNLIANETIEDPEVVSSMYEKLKQIFDDCPNDFCIAKKTGINTKYIFKPLGPSKKEGWLSNFDIRDVLSQYERVFPDFQSYDPVPVDFKSIYTELKGDPMIELAKSGAKSRFGVVVNHDYHDGPGTHWVAIFMDMASDPVSIEYSDSVGDQPPKLLKDYLSCMKDKITKALGKPAVIRINNIQHQRGNNECGVYSLHYIIQRLMGHTFEEITKNVIGDKKMNQFRKFLFMTPSK
jgi:hypothetical protein